MPGQPPARRAVSAVAARHDRIHRQLVYTDELALVEVAYAAEPTPLIVVAFRRPHAPSCFFLTGQPQSIERTRDRGVAGRNARLGCQLLAQLAECGVVVGGEGCPRQIVGARPEARDVTRRRADEARGRSWSGAAGVTC